MKWLNQRQKIVLPLANSDQARPAAARSSGTQFEARQPMENVSC
jgi:hypothetical protein